jgi:hypothetical protein
MTIVMNYYSKLGIYVENERNKLEQEFSDILSLNQKKK